MKAQIPAEGIVSFKSYPDMKMFRIPCECSCDNEMDVMLEVDDGQISTSFDVKVKSQYWKEPFKVSYTEMWFVIPIKQIVNAVHHRVSVIWEVLTKGYVTSHATILMSKQQTLNFAHALNDAVDAFDVQRKQLDDMITTRKAKNAAAKKV